MHENEYIKPRKTFCRNSKQFLRMKNEKSIAWMSNSFFILRLLFFLFSYILYRHLALDGFTEGNDGFRA